MKATFIGGGSHRLLGILRSALAVPGVLDDGEINLYDLAVDRAEALGRMLRKTPEYARASNCRVVWGTSLAEALDGADMVGVILMAGSRERFDHGNVVSLRNGFLGSDNLSPNGALLALKGGPILLHTARHMAVHCPDAWLVNFANPVAVHSGMLNNHTRIRTLGVCAGYTNHQWDLARLMGRDEQWTDFDVDVAGINHFSFIGRGSWHGRDLFELLDERLADPAWRVPQLHSWWRPVMRRHIRQGIRRLARIYRELGALLFSTEGDGMAHLYYEEALKDTLAARAPDGRLPGVARIRRDACAGAAARAAADHSFRTMLERDLDQAFWDTHWRRDSTFGRVDHDIFVQILKGIAGVAPVKIATSRPNAGAVAGFTARTVLEYSQVLHGQSIRPVPDLTVPDTVYGMTGALAIHQTLLGDAIAAEDPRLLARALLAYPIRAFSKAQRRLWKDLLALNASEIPSALVKAREFL